MGSTPRLISASRGAAVLGVSGWATPLSVWQEIEEELHPGFNKAHGYTLPEREESAAMRWGTAMESAVIGLAERASGKQIADREMAFLHDFDPGNFGYIDDGLSPGFIENRELFVTCHIDGRYQDKPVITTLHEGKTASAFTYREKWGKPGTDHIPDEYQVQVQHQMICTGAEKVIVSVLVWPKTPEEWESEGWEVIHDVVGDYYLKKNDVRIMPFCWADTLYNMGFFFQYPVEAKKSVQEMMLSGYRRFWERHVIPGIPPEPENYDDIKRLFVNPAGTILCDTEMEGWWREYDGIRQEIGAGGTSAKRQEQLKIQLLNKARKLDPVMDDESREKVVFRSSDGKKLGQYSKKGGFR
jgi:hypothetical protein